MSIKIPFFKGTSKNKQKETAISSEEILENAAAVGEEEVLTKLYFFGGKPKQIEDQYYFQFLLNELAPLKRNQLSLSPLELRIEEETVYAQFFFRQSLEKEITLGTTPLVLLDESGKTLGRIDADLSELGVIPAESAMPWIVAFEKEHLLVPVEDILKENWSIAFEQKLPHRLDLDENWEQSLASADKEQLAKVVEGLAVPKKNELNFMGLNQRFQEDGSLAVTILIRSGHEKNVSIEKLPLEVMDAAKEIVAKGAFTLPPLTVQANTSKPWTFIFPNEMVLKEQPDFSSWSVKVIENN
ncbi:accessory Sec system S-layer assembly protein [Psychrobacillus sp. FSL H8-0483]|uniref:accessory Sec system S-layer assembly protein n=1 Tax=Psychrobacillus sp. FSL H8-0483 TaxID=2921389 RepID=UPI003159DEC0